MYRTPCGTGKSSACVMNILWEELKRNNIDIEPLEPLTLTRVPLESLTLTRVPLEPQAKHL